MKRITILSMFIVLNWTTINAQSFDLDIQPATQQILVGGVAEFNISINSVENFNQQIVFDVLNHNLNSSNVSFAFTPQYVESPYVQDVIFSASTNGAIDVGDYYIVIEAGNGPVLSKDTCYFSVVNDTCEWVEVAFDSQYFLLGMSFDNENNLWASNSDDELLKRVGNSWETINGPGGNFRSKFAIDSNNIIWVATDGGLAKWDGVEWTVYNTTNSQIISNDLTSVVVDNDNVVWVGTDNSGIIKFDGTYWTIYNSSNTNLVDNNAEKLIFDENGSLWFVNYDDCIAKFTGSDFVLYNSSNSCLPSTDILSLAFDLDNSLWIGHRWGLIKYNGQEWEEWSDASNNNHIIRNNNCEILVQNNESELIFESCSYIYIDNDNNKWINNLANISFPPSKVFMINSNNWIGFTPDNSTIPDNTLRFICQNESENMWFNTIQYTDYIYSSSLSIKPCVISLSQNIDKTTVNQTSFEVYPNPANDYFTVNLPNNIQSHITILDITGKIKFQEYFTNQIVLSSKNLKKGMYFVRIKDYKSIKIKKVIIE